MTGFIQVESGPQTGKQFLIPQEVCRVGSGATMDVQIPSISEHAITILARDNGYSVINRECGSLKIAGKPLKSSDQREWRFGTKLSIGETSLRLAREYSREDESRESPQDAGTTIHASTPGGTDHANSPQAKSLTRLAAVSVVLFFVFGGSHSKSSIGNGSAFYVGLTRQARDATPYDDYRMKHARYLVQRGRLEELWQNPEDARKYYAEAQAFLRQRRPADDPYASNRALQNLEFKFNWFLDDRLQDL